MSKLKNYISQVHYEQWTSKNQRGWSWWSPPPNHTAGISKNFGDLLTDFIVSRIIKNELHYVPLDYSRKILGIGSILSYAKPGDLVWGTGINGKNINSRGEFILHHQQEKITYLSVRGPRTRSVVLEKGGSCPEIYGDPAILLSLDSLFPELHNNVQQGIIAIPHFYDINTFNNEIEQYSLPVKLVSPDNDPGIVLSEVARAELVVTSSLHGIITSMALDTPVIFVRVSNREPIFKFEDFFFGIGADLPNTYSNLKAALTGECAQRTEMTSQAKKILDILPGHFNHNL